MIKLFDSTTMYNTEHSSLEDAFNELDKQIKKQGFECYYLRLSGLEDGNVMVDYGSHTHVFYLYDKENKQLFSDIIAYKSNVFPPADFGKGILNNSDKTVLYEDLQKTKKEIEAPSFSLIGVSNVAKFIEAMTDKNGLFEFRVWTDEFQAHRKPEERSYTIEVADRQNGQKFIFDSEENWEENW